MRQQRARQIDLFQDTDTRPALSAAIEEEVFAVLVQILQSMIAVLTAEAADEQDHQ